ncbi:alpha/beta fold hydrolase [Tsukamurella soli]|uniref:AB hydrolase-1 domain-containing protein n=1 Tax=Tsukamurella soli TaxID=644556 RepID=A0ABP8JFE3_9ACTN
MTHQTTSKALPPLVLLHGGRHGGWCWRRVALRLRAAGHEVYTPTLTGLGDRAHLLSRDIGLDTHVQDLVATFEFEDIEDAVLVAHSYGGVVATGAMEQLAPRVRRLVYLDAQIPRTGESVFGMVGPERTAVMEAMVEKDGDGWFVPPSDARMYGVTDPDDIEWANRRITAQPVKTYRDAAGPTEQAWRHPGMFIECTPSRIEENILTRARERSATDPTFGYRILGAPHNAMVTHPDVLAALLLDPEVIG